MRTSAATPHRCNKLVKAIEAGAVRVNLLNPAQMIVGHPVNILIDYCPWCGKKLCK